MDRAILDRVLQAKQSKTAVVLATDLADGSQQIIDVAAVWQADDPLSRSVVAASIADRSQTVELEDGRRLFLNVFNPPLRMIVVGAVHITQALAPMARIAGYDVIVIDPREAFATAERFPDVSLSHAWPDEAMAELMPDRRTAVITLTHDPKLDDPALQAALISDCFYIGALGSRKTHGARLERLRRAGFDEAAMARIHGPIGLAIGARSPAEIAIAVMAQVTETLRKMPEPQARAA
ncbi:XdhC family protein [Marinibaculum pumilum]|uniref:XdhC family protein n=1 Tax=Marinibaculum pumilum TaxID=1766165 RepID=A0ABV7KUG7_9PROT